MPGWSKWIPDGTGEEINEKVTVNDDGSSKYESLRTNDKSKEDHQHVYINRDSKGELTEDKHGVVGGATPGKSTPHK